MTWRDTPPEHQLPPWVRIWNRARAARDMRLLPEQELGYRTLDREWNQDMHVTRAPSGYDWSSELEERGLMPAKDRAQYTDTNLTLIDDDIPF